MSSQKTHDLVIRVGEYTDRDGQKRSRTKNVGALYTRDDGSVFVALDSFIVTMEAQYLCNPKRDDRVLLSAYAPREEKGAAPPAPSAGRAAPSSPAAATKAAKPDFDDEIPF